MSGCERCDFIHKACPCGCHDKGICKCNTASECDVHKHVTLQGDGTFQ